VNSDAVRHLPRIFEASNGQGGWSPSAREVGLLLRDTNLAALLAHAGLDTTLAVDCDGVEGLGDDRAAAEFLVLRLGFRVVLTRHAVMATNVASLGGLAFLKVYALDSEGLHHSLEGHPREPAIGTAICPGLVLAHLEPGEVSLLPRPILGYGLLEAPADIAACLAIADAVVLRRSAIEGLAAQHHDGREVAPDIRRPAVDRP
jgi:glycerol-3-phosphate responsive antiterminator